MVKVSSTPKTGQPRAVVSRHLNDRDAAASVSSAVIDERPDTLHSVPSERQAGLKRWLVSSGTL
jgi:hypothetical protein